MTLNELLDEVTRLWTEDPAGVPIYIAAINAIRQARRDGRHKHDPKSWIEESVDEELLHAHYHLVDYTHGIYMGTGRRRQDIEHATTRLSILLAMLDLFEGGFTRAAHGMPSKRGPGLDDTDSGGDVT